MTKIINIRGANGAGKTTLVRSIMKGQEVQDVGIGTAKTPGHWLPGLGIVIVGPYPDGKATGGMDNVRTTEEALRAVEAAYAGRFAPVEAPSTLRAGPIRGVIFEGILISTVYRTWLEFSQLHTTSRPGREVQFYWAFLPASATTCLERVKLRRAQKGRPEEGFKEDLVLNKHLTISRLRERALSDAQAVIDLPAETEEAREMILDLIAEEY